MKYSNHLIEELLLSFQPAMGADYDKYRNHVYRVFLNCLLLDADKLNADKYAVAAVFHDIGIWTDHTIDYLDPSIEQARIYLQQTNKMNWMEEIQSMIYWHHKVGTYEGEYNTTVETFRRADWIDVSLGIMNFGVDKKNIQANRKAFPNFGFHWFLVKKVGRQFLRHPLNPLPMFKN